MGRPRNVAEPEAPVDEPTPPVAEEVTDDSANPYAPSTSKGPDEVLPGVESFVGSPDPDERETDNLGVPAGYVSVYNGPSSSQPVLPGNPVVSTLPDPIEVEQPAPEETTP